MFLLTGYILLQFFSLVPRFASRRPKSLYRPVGMALATPNAILFFFVD
jgi:hypothetical protein